jgi:hypothetical protein
LSDNPINTGLLIKTIKRVNKMNVQRLLNDDDYFSDWFISENLESLVNLAKLQGFNHNMAVFFELNNIY